MSDTSRRNTIRAGAVGPKQGFGDTARLEQHSLALGERINGREAGPGEMPAQLNAQSMVHIWHDLREIRKTGPICPPLRQIAW